jgi:hypothetical protein
MANVKKEGEFLNTDDFVTLLAERGKFTKGDVKVMLKEMQGILEECVIKGVDVDLRGILHLTITDMEFTKTPGIIAYNGDTEFNKNGKRIKYRVPLNFKTLLRESNKKEKV